MGRRYEQLSLEERRTLSRLKQAGKTVRQILVDFSAALVALPYCRTQGNDFRSGRRAIIVERQIKSYDRIIRHKR